MGRFSKKTRDATQSGAIANRKRVKKDNPTKPRSKRRLLRFRGGRVHSWFRTLARLGLAGVITAAVVFAGVMGYRHITTSSYFAFRDPDITGEQRLSEAEILDTGGLTLEENIFGIDLASVKRKLLGHPWIAEADVGRKLPGKLEIRIVERKARAIVNFDVLYLVDDTGKVFKRWKRGDPMPTPVITGISREQFVENSASVEDILRDAIDLADRYRASGLNKQAALAEIHWEMDGGFSLTAGDDPVYIRFGKGPYRNKLTRLSTLLAKLASDKARPAIIYFDNEIRPDRITVKLKRDEQAAVFQHENSTDETKKRVSKI